MVTNAGDVFKKWRGGLFPWIGAIYLVLIHGVPTALVLAGAPLLRSPVVAGLALPVLWVIGFLLLAGCLSLPHQFAVKAGKVRRNVNDRAYFHRRLYGLCWTAVFYNKPVYFLVLSVPVLKWMTFRLFGYRGSMNFTVYPDTWIRDLPVLHFEDGVYVSNRATIGTNIVLKNGFLLVGPITLRKGALVGHLAMLAPGVELMAGAEVAVGCAIGIKAVLGAGSFVGPCTAIEHGVQLGAKAAIGPHSYVGSGSVIPEGVTFPGGTVIAQRTVIPPGMPLEHSSFNQGARS